MKDILVVDLAIFAFILFFYKFYPKKINLLFGYRTKQSMKSEKKWLFAQQFFSKQWLYIIPITLISQIPILIDQSIEKYLIIITVIQFISITAYNIYLTEKELKKMDD